MKNIGTYQVIFCVLAAILLGIVAWSKHFIGYVFAGIVVLLCGLYWIITAEQLLIYHKEFDKKIIKKINAQPGSRPTKSEILVDNPPSENDE